MKPIEVWFAVGSTYTWLAVTRIASLSGSTSAQFSWHPYSTRERMAELGTLPKNAPVKLGYMWRDIERRALRLGLSPRLPAPYPLEEYEKANWLAIVAASEGWCLRYLVATYSRWLEHGEPAGSMQNLSNCLSDLGVDPKTVLARAQQPDITDGFRANTDAARRLEIFGAPTFRVGNEIFWGEDRLDDAIQWARDGRLS
jgi:2-hydroxychromene-2-carboxylate isomerase